MKILVIAWAISDLMEYHLFLTSKNITCDIAKNYREAKPLVALNEYCCILIDSELELQSQFKLSKLCRKTQKSPIVYLGVPVHYKELEQFRTYGFDYIQKSWPKTQIWKRIRSSIEYFMGTDSFLKVHILFVDLIERHVLVNNKHIYLSPLQFDILVFLMKYPDTIHSMEEIYLKVWNKSEVNPLETVQVNISRLRQNLLQVYPEHDFITTVRSKGYRFNSK